MSIKDEIRSEMEWVFSDQFYQNGQVFNITENFETPSILNDFVFFTRF